MISRWSGVNAARHCRRTFPPYPSSAQRLRDRLMGSSIAAAASSSSSASFLLRRADRALNLVIASSQVETAERPCQTPGLSPHVEKHLADEIFRDPARPARAGAQNDKPVHGAAHTALAWRAGRLGRSWQSGFRLTPLDLRSRLGSQSWSGRCGRRFDGRGKILQITAVVRAPV